MSALLQDIARARRALAAIERRRTSRHTIALAVIGDITASTGASGGAFSARTLQAALRRDPKAPAVVRIDSLGGLAVEGLRCFDVLRAHKGEITARVTGQCHSAATLVLAGGDIRDMPPPARLVIHQPAIADVGALGRRRLDPGELRRVAGHMDDIGQKIAAAYEAATGTPARDWIAMMNEESALTSFRAASLGLVNRIGGYAVNLSRWR